MELGLLSGVILQRTTLGAMPNKRQTEADNNDVSFIMLII